MMDQDVLTNVALGALWKQDQGGRLNKFCQQTAGLRPSPSRLAMPGFLVNCISQKGTENVSFPELHVGQKRKANWAQSRSQSNCGTRAPKKTKFSLKEMADQFTASQIQLAARSVAASAMLPRAPHDKSNKLPGISQSLNVLMSQNPESTLASTTKEAQSDEIDMSWLDPTPIREPTPTLEPACSSLEPTPIRELTNSRPSTDSSRSDNTEKVSSLQLVSQDFSSATPTVEEPSMLHQTVRLFPTNYDLVKGALDLDPQGVRRKESAPKYSDSCASSSFGYPLNIALQEDASLDVLQLLANAAPEVITSRDGSDESGSLSLVLQRQTYSDNKFLQVLHLLIKANPMSLRMTDRFRNTPLHIALAGGAASLELVRVLCMLYPPALLQTNLKGETPLQVAQRSSTRCQDNVLKFAQEAYKQELRRLSTARD